MTREGSARTTARQLDLKTAGLGLLTILALVIYLASLAVLTWQDNQNRKLARVTIEAEPPGIMDGETVTATLAQPQRY